MVQFNLLPDVKIEYIKTKYRKRLIMVICGVLSSAAFAVFIILLLYVRVNQTKYISDLNKDIQTNVKTIKDTQDLDKILTIQNQLNTLPGLHEKKVVASRTFDFFSKVTPAQVTISNMNVDFTTNTILISGNADTLVTVNKYVDSLKFTEYKYNNDSGTGGKAFKDVVLNSFSLPVEGSISGSAYAISFTFDPLLFAQVKDDKSAGAEAVILNVPKITSTRSETEKPLFVSQPTKTEEKKQ